MSWITKTLLLIACRHHISIYAYISSFRTSRPMTVFAVLSRYIQSSLHRHSSLISPIFASTTDYDLVTIKQSSSSHLQSYDKELYTMIEAEDRRQRVGLEMIASENFVSSAVREALGSCLTNKYSEGSVGKRYYGGNQYIDQIEALCISRALDLFGLSSKDWGVNVQPYSGSPANFAVYTALLNPHERLMGLDLPSGGHLTHGFQTNKKKVSATSVYFESMPYVVDVRTGLIDYDDMEKRVRMFLPKLLIAGGSAYPREWDYKRMREIADSVGALLMVDMAHISGLVAGGCVANPFEYADIVTSTTHKTLRGPRSGVIFAKKSFMEKIDSAVFPSLQGGPHNHQIAALAVALKEANTPEFRLYANDIIQNAKALASALLKRGHVIATGGTDNHLMLWDVRVWGLTGNMVEKLLEMVSITTNKNSLPGDVSAINPGGVRLGTPALTTRGLKPDDFDTVADFLDRGCKLAIKSKELAAEASPNGKVLLKDFLDVCESNDDLRQQILSLQREVEAFAVRFTMPSDVSL